MTNNRPDLSSDQADRTRTDQVDSSPSDDPGERLASRGFLGLLATQFLGALNDNMFRWLAVPIAQPIVGNVEALSLGLACFTLPYLVLATLAGYLADRFSKRSVIIGCKVAEIIIMVMGISAILLGNVYLLFLVVALMGAQSALFGPAKFGSIPEIVKSRYLSTGNGLMGLITVTAAALGTIAGYWLFGITKPDLAHPGGLLDLWPAVVAVLGVAVAGLMTSFSIKSLPAADANRKLAVNPFTETINNLRLLGSDLPLFRTALGIAFFWMLASLAQMNIDPFADEMLGLSKSEIGPLMGILVAGLGLGSVLAGVWSGGKVELGIVPLGAAGITASSALLFYAGNSVDPSFAATGQSAYRWTCLWLFTLGISAGLFDIPLEAHLQARSNVRTRGTILAASNFVSFSFILGIAGLFVWMQKSLRMTPADIFLVAGLGTIPVMIYIVRLLPQATIRFLVWLFSHSLYRLRVYGRENIPEQGGGLIVANHVSWLDGILILLSSSRPIRMIVYDDYVQGFGIRWITRLFHVIPIKGDAGPKALLRSLKTAKQAIRNGELVCIFAEGQITRTGQLQPFQRGLLRVVDGTGAPIIPAYLDELWGSIFSYERGRFFWKRPRRWPYPITIVFGKPLSDPKDVHQVRHAVAEAGVEAMQYRKGRRRTPPRRFLRVCRKGWFRPKVADSSGAELTGGKLLIASLIFRRLLNRQVLARDETMVGILLPPSVGGTIANAAVTLSRRVAVNLNYTMTDETVNHCIAECNIRHVLTSRRFLEKKPFQLDAEFVFLEDLKEQISGLNKLISLIEALLPTVVLERLLRLTRIRPDDLMTVIFTSGSTGEPKGVMLSHDNIQSNVDAIEQLFHFTADDTMLGILPFFHSFGYTGTLWLPLALSPKVVYHFNPLDARQIGKLCERHDVTITVATPTFLRTYLKRCTPKQFRTLNTVITGAEKLPSDLCEAFQKKFDVTPSEGYGTTELSPVVSGNVPEIRADTDGTGQVATKLGTVGRPLPGIAAKVVDAETGKDLGVNTEGLLFIKGPNVMQGYLHHPGKTAEVIRDGWYNTSDFARIDEDGFIEITGRQSRFSKIGGEMVPHIKVEELLRQAISNNGSDDVENTDIENTDTENTDTDSDEPDVRLVVTSVPHPTKGERLVVLHKPLAKSIDEVLQELSNENLPNLWIPSRDSFLEIDSIPVLGTGKLDLKSIKQTALDAFAPESVTGKNV